ncbi:MAG: F0F1 ATP synthase subunit gamma [Candidatus Saccharibacteria bacterium]
MNKITELYREYQDVSTIEEVARIFENSASIQVRQIKNRVLASRDFLHELWSMYVQLRLDSGGDLDIPVNVPTNDKTAVILISSDESLGGTIDERLIEEAISVMNPGRADYFVIGKKGARIMKAQGIEPTAAFKLPDITKPVNVIPIIYKTQEYKSSVVYFEQFINIDTQQIQVFELISGIKRVGQMESSRRDASLIFTSDYIFEPSLKKVISYLESMMRATVLTELILESRLAQLANRFNTMNQAGANADKIKNQLYIEYKRARRQKEYSEMQIFHQKNLGIMK